MSIGAEASDFSAVRVSATGPVGELVLNRPEKRNALSIELLEELIAAADWFTARGEVKVVVVRGAGKSFCAGADLGSFAGAVGDASEEDRRAAADLGRRAAEALTGTRPVTVAAIHGHCVGGGLVLAAACDLRLAAEGTVFAIPEVDIGIPLAWGGIPRLVREIGPAATRELVLTCRPFTPGEAKELGLLNRVAPEAELGAEAGALAERLSAQPAYSLELTKRHVNAVIEESGSTAGTAGDADALLGAFADPESLEKMQQYLSGRG